MTVQKLGQLTTAICCCNAFCRVGHSTVFHICTKTHAGTAFGAYSTGYHSCADYGWINGETFLQGLQFFAEQCRRAATR